MIAFLLVPLVVLASTPQMIAVTCDMDDDAPDLPNEIVAIDSATGALTPLVTPFKAWSTNCAAAGYAAAAAAAEATLYLAVRQNSSSRQLAIESRAASGGGATSQGALTATSPPLEADMPSLYAPHFDSATGSFYATKWVDDVVFGELDLRTGGWVAGSAVALNVSWAFEYCLGSDAFDGATGVLHQMLVRDGAEFLTLVSVRMRRAPPPSLSSSSSSSAAPRISFTTTNLGASDFLANPVVSGGVLYGFDRLQRLGTMDTTTGRFALFPGTTRLRAALGDAFGHAVVRGGLLFATNSTEFGVVARQRRRGELRALGGGGGGGGGGGSSRGGQLKRVRMHAVPPPQQQQQQQQQQQHQQQQQQVAAETSKSTLCTFNATNGKLLRCVGLARPTMYMYATSAPVDGPP